MRKQLNAVRTNPLLERIKNNEVSIVPNCITFNKVLAA
jgi:hypothetical protein